MDCPKCDGVLEPNQVSAVLVHVCTKCAGIWLRYGQLRPLLEAWSQGMDFTHPRHKELIIQGPRVGLNTDQIMGACPLCPARTLMLPETRDVGALVRIDYCRRGHGLWLDAGEVRQIQSRILHKTDEYHRAICQALLPDREAA
jgi:Zn-finger nucleic acid-binding protein